MPDTDENLLPSSGSTPDASAAGSSPSPDVTVPASSSDPVVTTTATTEPANMEDAIAQAFDQSVTLKPEDPLTAPKPDADVTPDATPSTEAAPNAADPTGANPDTEAAPTGDEPEPTKEELAGMTPSTRRRFHSLLGQRIALRQEIATLQPAAEGYRTIRQFMAKNNLSDQEFAEGAIAMADLKSGDPKRVQAFVDRVSPYLQTAREIAGQAVASDLTARVAHGEMTEEAAREMTALRHQREAATQAAQRATQAQVAVETGATRQSIHSAVADWNAKTRLTDPDFALKADAMTIAAKALVADKGLPRTPAEAVAYSQEVYATVNRMFASAKPARAATQPTPLVTTASANRPGMRPEPASLEDAIGQAFDRANRG